jgi:hypothetical protein
MTDDFRALCIDLLNELENAVRIIYNEGGTRHISDSYAVIVKARAMCAIMVPAEKTTHYSPPSTMENQTRTTLSPAAQAVLDAAMDTPEEQPYEFDIAAALRAAADQVVPEEPENEDFDGDNHDDKAEWFQWSQRTHTRRELLVIAAELEAHQ